MAVSNIKMLLIFRPCLMAHRDSCRIIFIKLKQVLFLRTISYQSFRLLRSYLKDKDKTNYVFYLKPCLEYCVCLMIAKKLS